MNGGMARLPGFLIAIDSLGANKLPIIDEAAMLALGMTPADLAALKAEADKGENGKANWGVVPLPQSIYFVIDRAPVRAGSSYDYPDLIDMSYQRFTEPVLGKDGRQINDGTADKPKWRERKHFRPWCIGDGETAKRIQDDGSVREIRCALIGNGDPASVCPWSANGSCKAHTTLAVTLAVQGKERLEPLSRVRGMRHRLETKSPHNGASFFKVLDTVTRRLEGNIGGIDGTLRFVNEATSFNNDGRPSETTVGRVRMELNPFAIEARLDAMRAARGYHIAAPEPQALLSAPEDAGDMPDVGEDMAPPLQPGEPSRGEAINAGLEDGHSPMDDPPIWSTAAAPEPAPAKLTMKQIGAMLKAKFEASGTDQAAAIALIKRMDFDPARIEAALDADIKARAEAMAEEAAAKPAANQTEDKPEETIL